MINEKWYSIENLKKLNLGAFYLHFISAIVLGVLFFKLEKELSFDTGLRKITVTFNDSQDQKNITLGTKNYQIGKETLNIITILFFAITAIFHFFYYKSDLYDKEIRKGYNRFRWLEYAITSTLMIFILQILSGVKDIYGFVCVLFLNAVLMSYGYFLELSKDSKSKLISLIIGFTILVFIWAILFSNFYYVVGRADEADIDIPKWIYGVLIPMFFWWTSFGIVAALYYKNYKEKKYKFNFYEFLYIILSYFSKAFMGYYLAYGLLNERS